LLGTIKRRYNRFGEGAARIVWTKVLVYFFHSQVGVFSAVFKSRAGIVDAAAEPLIRIFPGAVVVTFIDTSVALVRLASLVYR